MKRPLGLLALLVLALLVLVRAWAAAPVDAGWILQREFRDQYGEVHSVARRRGTPLIVVVVDISRLAMIEKWERDLDNRVPGIRFMNVADFPAGAPVDPERAARTLRKRVPPGVSVLMDPSREWANTFALDTALPNLLLFDATGQLSARFRGRWTTPLAVEVAAAVAAAMPGQGAAP